MSFVAWPSHERWAKIGASVARTTVAVLGALVIFGALMLAEGVDPVAAYREMWTTTFTNWDSLAEVLIKAAPVILAALAVAVPARAGLVNVGGEGQLVVGGVGAAGAALLLGASAPGWLALVIMGVAAALTGAIWAAIAAGLRLKVGINEAVSTLLLNYIAIDLLLFLIYDAWKDPAGVGQPTSKPLPASQHLPLLFGSSRLHAGIVIAVVATVVVALLLGRTIWGFELRAVGGNPEAARRAGLPVGRLLMSSMLVGGALAGLGGFVQFAGIEFTLRSGFLLGYGYIAFLASWLARHRPVRVMLAATLLAAISISGDSLQLDSGLPAASVNVLMALVLLAVFGWSRTRPARFAT